MSNPLEDIVPPRYRKAVYALLGLAAIVLAAWQAAQGDWFVFVGLVLGALGFGTATANTDTAPRRRRRKQV